MAPILQLTTLFIILGLLAVAAIKVAEHNRFMRELEFRRKMFREKRRKLDRFP